MIKATDLMIGNWVSDTNGKRCIIETIDNDGCDVYTLTSDILQYLPIKSIYGIPLTPDMMERIDWNGYNKLYLNSYFKIDDVGHLYYCSDFTGINIYYVHQLQNLCKALTGKDLKFKTT